jgi:hypothetical protein
MVTFFRCAVLWTLFAALSVNAQTSKVVTFGNKMQCGVVRRAVNNVQVYCYQGSTVVFNSSYTVSPVVVSDYRYSVTKDRLHMDTILWRLELSDDTTTISYEFTFNATLPQKGILK